MGGDRYHSGGDLLDLPKIITGKSRTATKLFGMNAHLLPIIKDSHEFKEDHPFQSKQCITQS